MPGTWYCCDIGNVVVEWRVLKGDTRIKPVEGLCNRTLDALKNRKERRLIERSSEAIVGAIEILTRATGTDKVCLCAVAKKEA